MKKGKPKTGTLTSELPRGVETQVLLRLQKEKIEVRDFQELIKNDGLLSKIAESFFRHRLWLIEEILENEAQAHKDFFGYAFDLTIFKEDLKMLGPLLICKWEALGFEPHFFPSIQMPKELNLPGWKVKPEDWYYDRVSEGKILRRSLDNQMKTIEKVKLDGETVLIDARLKPKYNNGKQMFFQDDFIGGILANLRKNNEIAKYEHGNQTSRFGVSAEEWEHKIRLALAEKLVARGFGIVVDRIRLETALEANVIPQLYQYTPRKNDGTTDVSIWYEEYFDGSFYHLHGGNSDYGGLADVHWRSVGLYKCNRAFRPIIVL